MAETEENPRIHSDFQSQVSGCHIHGWLAGSDALLCSQGFFGLGIVPRPSILCESIKFSKGHSSSLFFCNQYCFPRSFCNQLLSQYKPTKYKGKAVVLPDCLVSLDSGAEMFLFFSSSTNSPMGSIIFHISKSSFPVI